MGWESGEEKVRKNTKNNKQKNKKTNKKEEEKRPLIRSRRQLEPFDMCRMENNKAARGNNKIRRRIHVTTRLTDIQPVGGHTAPSFRSFDL